MNRLPIVYLVIVSICSSLFAVFPLFSDGFFPMHDDVQPSRVYEMYRGIQSGQFPVRWVPDLGYGTGYSLFNFYAPFSYYVGSIPMFFGYDALFSAKVMIIIGIMSAGISMSLVSYFVTRDFFSSLLSGMLYVYAPYHAVQVYVRGSISELYAYAWIPFVWYGVCEVLHSRYRRGVMIGSVWYGLVLISHNILGMMLGYILLCVVCGTAGYMVWRRTKKIYVLLSLVGIVICGIGLSAWFVLPALFENGYTRVATLTQGGSDYRQHFVMVDQLWNSPWGFAGSAPGRDDGMSFRIGKLHVLFGILAISVYVASLFRASMKTHLSFRFIVWCILVISLGGVYVMTEYSFWIWDVIPAFSYIQYPWRFLSLVVFCLSLSPLALFWVFPSWIHRTVGVSIFIGIYIYYVPLFVPSMITNISHTWYTSYDRLSGDLSRISDEYLPHALSGPYLSEEKGFSLVSSGERSLVLPRGSIDGSTTITMEKSEKIMTNLSYVPGWNATIDGIPTAILSDTGYISLQVPEGVHEVRIFLRQTWIQYVSNAISFLFVFLLGYLSLSKSRLLWQKNVR